MLTEKKTNGSSIIPDLLWYSCDSMMVIDDRRRILAINPALEQLTGKFSEELAGRVECGALLSCRDLQGCSLKETPSECPGLKAIESFQPVRNAEYSIRVRDGKAIVVSSSYTPIQLPGHPVWTLGILRDITMQKRKELRLIQQAKTDPLTRLPNRTALMELCLKELSRAARYSRPLAVAMVDIDGFKRYNDTYGHPAGDDLLRALAELVRAGRRLSDLVARYGGDEFALLMPETDAADAVLVAEKICRTVARFPFARNQAIPTAQDICPISMSIGVAIFPEDGDTPEGLLAKADRRMYEAKRGGGNQVVAPPLQGETKGGAKER